MDYANGGSGTYWGAKEDRPVNDSRVTPDEGPDQGPTELKKVEVPLPKININLTQEAVYDKNGLLLGYGDDGLERKKQLDELKYADKIGDAASDASMYLCFAQFFAILSGNPLASESFGSVASFMDATATLAYMVAGNPENKAFTSLISVVTDVVPVLSIYKKASYNPIAKRYIDKATKRFITNFDGFKTYVTPVATGLVISIGNIVLDPNTDLVLNGGK